jgi:AbrB family looped-hinge helix DNA binding protein
MNFNMSDVSTTKMTSKGQVVIPEEIREHMHLEAGVKFIVMATDDSIIFKKINPISRNDIKSLLDASHAIAREYEINENDIEQAINDVRKSSTKRTYPIKSQSSSQAIKRASSNQKSKPRISNKTSRKKVVSSKDNYKGKHSKQ